MILICFEFVAYNSNKRHLFGSIPERSTRMADPTADEIKAAELKARMKFLFGVEKTFDPLWESRRNSSNDLEKHVFIMKRVQGNSNTDYHCIYCTWKRTGTSSVLKDHFKVN
jgi:hypothetical protein